MVTIPMVLDRFVVITENICEFYKVVDNRAYRMGYLLLDKYYEETLMYVINNWNIGQDVELLT